MSTSSSGKSGSVAAHARPRSTSTLAPLAAYEGFVVKQRVEPIEYFGVEGANVYDILSLDGTRVLHAREREGGVWGTVGRQLGGHTVHAFDIDVCDNAGRTVLTISHPARWFLQRLEVRSGSGRLIGVFEECFSLVKELVVKDGHGHPRFAMSTRFLSPWNFTFTRAAPRTSRRVAHIQKQWDGLGRELFTDADTLRIAFEARDLDTDERALLLAAALFIDLVWFEWDSGGIVSTGWGP